jgi:nucleotide-binding universal stress UspA family protein
MSEIQRLINKILLPIDGSEGALKAAEVAIVIARGVIAEILAIHVIQERSIFLSLGPEFPYIPPAEFWEKAEEEAMTFLKPVQEMCERSKVRLKTKVIRSKTSVVDAICRVAGEEKCDLIVMGTRGMTGIRKFLLGSVASGVITYAPCPVMVVR